MEKPCILHQIVLIFMFYTVGAENVSIDCKVPALLKINGFATLNCLLKNVPGNMNTTDLSVNLTKVSDNCISEPSNTFSGVTVNSTKTDDHNVYINFDNVTWGVSGDYLLTFIAENITVNKRIIVGVSDMPRLPPKRAINFTHIYWHGDHIFTIEAKLPKKHACDNGKDTQYSYSYTSKGCLVQSMRSNIPCSIQSDTDGISRDLLCLDDMTNVCSDHNLENCVYSMTINGSNVFGSTLMNITSPVLRYTVPALPARLPELSATGPRTLLFTWLKPYCSQIDFSYKILYGEMSGNFSYKTSLLLGDRSKVKIKKELKKLKPFTRYRVCVKVRNEVTDELSKERCKVGQTMEDVPSKAPEITRTISRDMKNGNGRWESEIRWKVPSREFWNGLPYLLVNSAETKTPQIVKRSKKLLVNVSSYILPELEQGRDYTVSVSLCTTKGCRTSALKNISHPGKPSSKAIFYVIAGILVFLLLVILGIIIFFFTKNRYKKLKEETANVQDQPFDNATVAPRPVERYEEPVPENEVYDEAPPFRQRRNSEEVDEDNYPHIDDPFEVRVADDFSIQSLDETELVPVNS